METSEEESRTKNTPPRQMPNQIAAMMLCLRSKRKGIIALSFLQYSMRTKEQKRTPAIVNRDMTRGFPHAYFVPPHENARRRHIVAATKVIVPPKSKRAI